MADAKKISGEVVHEGLILTPPHEEDWHLGSGKASQRFGSGSLNPSGNWVSWKPQDEPQRKGSFDSEGCAVFGTLKAYIMLAKFLGFEDFTKDASERYTGVFAGTTRQGTDPQVVAEMTRKKCGILPNELMPWEEDIDTFEEYYNVQMARNNLDFGSSILDRYTFGYEWVFAFGSTYSVEEKRTRLEAALKRGTVCVSIDGNYRYGKDGLIKIPGATDTHWVNLLRYDGEVALIHDQYAPYVKRLSADYDHNAAIVYFLQRKTETSQNFWSIVWDNFAKLWARQ